MSQLTKADFDSKFEANTGSALFKDNTSGDITAEDVRTFAGDIADTFLSISDNFIDEDSFASNSATKAPSQQSVKAYVDATVAGGSGAVSGSLTSGRVPVASGSNSLTDYNTFKFDGTKLAIGNVTPDSQLHVWESSAGSVTAIANTLVTIERNGAAYISILTPDANERGVYFGEASDNDAGGILYNTAGTQDGLEFRAGGSTKVYITSSGRLGIGVSPTTALHVSGGTITLANPNTGNTGLTMNRASGSVVEWQTYIPTGSTELRFYNSIAGGDKYTFDVNGIQTSTAYRATDVSGITTADAAYMISRTMSTGAGNGYGYSDFSQFVRPTYSYVSFNADIGIGNGGSANYDHYDGFKDNADFQSTGSIASMYSFLSAKSSSQAGTITNVYGLYAADTPGPATITNNYGVFVEALAEGTNNYAIYTDGSTPSVFEGQVSLGSAKITTTPSTDNTATPLAIDGSGNVVKNSNIISSGTYTPTLTAGVNVTSPGVAGTFRYTRIGSIVHVSGSINLTPSAISTNSICRISLPIASNFSLSVDLSGTASADVHSTVGTVEGNTTNDDAELKFTTSNVSTQQLELIFMYEIK